MNIKILVYGLLGLSIIGFTACKSKKNISDNPVKEEAGTLLLWDKMNASGLDYQWYYGKADAEVTFEGITVSGKADVRVLRDSLILLSVKKFGFELGRALIRPDSAFALNRLEGSYFALSTDSLRTLYDVPFGFDVMQDIIVGNLTLDDQRPLSSLDIPEGYLLKTGRDDINIDYKINKEFQVTQMNLRDSHGRTMESSFSDYKSFDSSFVTPGHREYHYPEKENAEYGLSLNMEKIEIDEPKKIKFEIPSNYTAM